MQSPVNQIRTLPFDMARCDPKVADAKCENCLRWSKMPGQLFGERTPSIVLEDSASVGCRQIAKESK